MTRGEFAEQLFVYCSMLGASVTSGARSELHNHAVGGLPNSPHRAGLGADVVYDAPRTNSERIRFATQLGLRLVIEKDHDHLQPMDWPPNL